ncbi:MAG: hypothetical protein ACI376_00325 [Candidatus Bruticola sp.]
MNLRFFSGRLAAVLALTAYSLFSAGQVLAQQPEDTDQSYPKTYSSPQNGSFLNPLNKLSPRLKRLKLLQEQGDSADGEQLKRRPHLEGFQGGYGHFFSNSNINAFTVKHTASDQLFNNTVDSTEIDREIKLSLNSQNEDPNYDNGEDVTSSLDTDDPNDSIFAGAPVHLIADKVTVTDDSIKAEGSASIDVMGARMLCNYLVLDKITGKITAVGDCIIYWNNNFVAADWLTYDPNSQITIMHNVTGQGHDFSSNENTVDGDIFFWADTLQWTKEKMVLTDSTFTTCDNPTDELDYKFVSKYVEIYPQDKLIASNTGIYFKNTRLYTMPTMNVPLDNKRRAKNSVIPQIGSNSVDGWFARNTFDYVFDNNNYGEILLDYYSKTGIGTGIRHYYSLGDKGGGDFYYYRLNGDKINSRYDLNSNIHYAFDDQTKISWEFSSNRSETPGFTNESRINSLFTFQHKDDRQDLRFSQNYNTKGSDTTNNTWRSYYNLQLTPELSTTWKAEMSTISTAHRTADRFHYQIGLRHTSELFDSDLQIENTNGDRNYSLNRNPEFTLRSHPIFLGDVPLLTSVSLGYVTESPSMYSTNRYDFQLQIPDQSFEYDSGRFLAGAGFRQLFYGNGQSMYSLAARLGWMQELGDMGTLRLDYNWLNPRGETPLQYDYITGYENLTGGIEFFKDDVFNFSVVSGYNLRTDQFQNVTPRLQFRPNKDWLVGASCSYDPSSHSWRNLDTNLRTKLFDGLYASHWSVYDLVNHRFTYQDYQLDYEAHDWVTSLVYRSVQNELYFQFSLKAFPMPDVTIGPSYANEIIPKNRRNAFVK